MTTLGIVAALKLEARTLAPEPVVTGVTNQLQGNILLKVSGIGAKRARLAAESLLAEGATALLSWGSAGGLAENLLPGNLILPKHIISADQSVFPVDAGWHERLCHLLWGQIDFHPDPLAESTAILNTPAEKRELFKQSGAAAVDMESAAVAEVASTTNLPLIAVRAIVDPFDMKMPSVVQTIDEYGRVRPLPLLGRLARNPAELFLLLRLGRYFRAARTSLTTVARLARNSRFAL